MYRYKTFGTCARAIELEVDGNKVRQVRFIGGCMGNTQGVAALVQGMEVDEAIRRLKGIQCGNKGTSCPDQLARALEEYKTRAVMA
ncbi:MAG: TIGR03905 family TSCPD domain-containing protein [Lachnospiraceae bacterium]|nr:TIGR03905 family TSCPD domain-containing protein [Lachnospiraceae bacterium]